MLSVYTVCVCVYVFVCVIAIKSKISNLNFPFRQIMRHFNFSTNSLALYSLFKFISLLLYIFFFLSFLSSHLPAISLLFVEKVRSIAQLLEFNIEHNGEYIEHNNEDISLFILCKMALVR